MHSVVYSKESARTLSRMPRKLALSIQAKITAVAADPYAKHNADPYAKHNNVASLKGRDGYRLPVAGWGLAHHL